jgi:hypothetical protein
VQQVLRDKRDYDQALQKAREILSGIGAPEKEIYGLSLKLTDEALDSLEASGENLRIDRPAHP